MKNTFYKSRKTCYTISSSKPVNSKGELHMLEKKIEELTEAVVNLTEVIKTLQSTAQDQPQKEKIADANEGSSRTRKPKETAAEKKKRLAEEAKAAAEDDEDDEDDEDEDDFDEDEDEDDDEISLSDCKELAKSKMADGVSRKAIKDLINKLGADTINKLEGKNLATFHKKLSAMDAE